MKKCVIKKCFLIVTIILLFVGTSIMPSTVGTMEKITTFSNSTSRGYIQDLIDIASDGDTIYIPSGIYYENIIINKSISLIGEDKNSTILDGGRVGDVVYVSADWVNISGFTIRNSESLWAGIHMKSNNSSILDNIILNNSCGIYILFSHNNNILDNIIIYNNGKGIFLDRSNDNTIKNNIISDNIREGIEIFLGSKYNIIKSNKITYNNRSGILINDADYNIVSENIISFNNYLGIFLKGALYNTLSENIIDSNKYKGIFIGCYYFMWTPVYSDENIVQNNSISNTTVGIKIDGGVNNNIRYNNIKDNIEGINIYYSIVIITNNNFLNNNQDAFFLKRFGEKNIWRQNYWNGPRILPKIIFGKDYVYRFYIPWINIDWCPAQEPYDI